jgi:SAM-dependent methyltransferase
MASLVGYDRAELIRKVCTEHCRRLVVELDPGHLDAVEIGAGSRRAWSGQPFRSYRALDWPEHDICAPLAEGLAGTADLVIAEHVFEHLLWPWRAVRNVHALLRPGGHFLVMTPFLVRVHEVPYDCSRWTETGMRHLLAEGGFPVEAVRTWSWGNLDAVKATLVTWSRVGWRRRFPNDPRFPVVVWALARKAG